MDLEIESFSEWFVLEPDRGQEMTNLGVVVGKKPENRTEARAIKGTVVCKPIGLIANFEKKVEVGDHVAVNWLDAVPVDIGGKDFLCVKSKDIMIRIPK